MSASVPLARTILAGALGAIVLNVMMLVTFRLVGFGWNGGGILLNPALQSPKLIAVWTEMEPLPLVVRNPIPIAVGLAFFAMVHAFLYTGLRSLWPSAVSARALRLAGLVFVLSFLFWEFFTPLNLFGEPPVLIALEIVFWALIALAEGIVVTVAIESN